MDDADLDAIRQARRLILDAPNLASETAVQQRRMAELSGSNAGSGKADEVRQRAEQASVSLFMRSLVCRKPLSGLPTRRKADEQ